MYFIYKSLFVIYYIILYINGSLEIESFVNNPMMIHYLAQSLCVYTSIVIVVCISAFVSGTFVGLFDVCYVEGSVLGRKRILNEGRQQTKRVFE